MTEKGPVVDEDPVSHWRPSASDTDLPGVHDDGRATMEDVPASLATGLVPLLLIVAADVWVYLDARSRQGTRREVSATVVSIQVDSPQAWLLWCVVLFVFAFPLYLTARRASA